MAQAQIKLQLDTSFELAAQHTNRLKGHPILESVFVNQRQFHNMDMTLAN